eukprot:CAMPEP_0185030540 /NCGR_PEP_ID=MMETSP1103-20130426/17533_1 /TAXON_ID=36769 /ORGANISM="Paraphysomonas bandaiensis, Strain Caron Lab Isolate" /LENGTH=394 /DNA_ID=CAMNT_0027565719 /DNA_START=133 /DNA_END=1314 /DNA_ORIENTATION=-
MARQSVVSDTPSTKISDHTEQKQTTIKPFETISFSSGGWLFLYMFGVGQCLKDRGYNKNIKCSGCSAGALTAAGMILDGDFEKAKQFCKDECVSRAYKSLFGIFKIAQYVSECLDYAIDLKGCSDIPEGNLVVAYTELPFMTECRAKSYDSPHDLKQCLLASSAAWPFAPPVWHRGSWLLDGCYSVYNPTFDENSITVSPLYFANTDIKPSRYVPIWWSLLPPSCEGTVDWLYELGYNDTWRWLDEREGKCSPVDGRRSSGNDKNLPYMLPKYPNHPYHTPRRITMHRFLGFDIAALTHARVAYVLDTGLYLLLNFVFRPAAVLLIYTELIFFLMVQVCVVVFKELFDISVMIPLFVLCSTPALWWLYAVSVYMVRNKHVPVGATREDRLMQVW